MGTERALLSLSFIDNDGKCSHIIRGPYPDGHYVFTLACVLCTYSSLWCMTHCILWILKNGACVFPLRLSDMCSRPVQLSRVIRLCSETLAL